MKYKKPAFPLRPLVLGFCVLLIGIFGFLFLRSSSVERPVPSVFRETVSRGMKAEDELKFREKLDSLLAERAKNEAAGTKDVNLFLRIGNQYYMLGELANAARSYRDILVTSPNDAPALENLGQALKEMGDYVGALEAWQRAADASPSETTYINIVELINEHLPEHDARVPAVLERGIAVFGQTYGILIRLGDWYAAHGDYARGVSHYEVALQLNRNEEAAKTLEEYRQKMREVEVKNIQEER